MSLSDRLDALAEAKTTAPPLGPVPSGWEPGIAYRPDGSRVVTSGPIPETDDPAPVLAAMGVVVPDGMRARLAEVRHDPAAWTRAAQGEDAVTMPVVRCRWVIEPAPREMNVDELLAAIRPRRKAPQPAASGATFCYSPAEPQVGKSDYDGSAGTVGRWYDALDRALTRYKELRKRGMCGPVLITHLGDACEGVTSQGGRLISRLDLTITEQIRVMRRLAADEVTAFSEVCDDVTVAAVAGNHGEAVRIGDQMATRYDDSWDIEALVQVADIMEAKGYDHVKWVFPGRDQLTVTVEASGTRIGLLHGHQLRRGGMEGWLSAKALDREPIGASDIVISGHKHSLLIEHLGPVTHFRTGAMDGGSIWWTHKGGLSSPPASLTFITDGGKWNSLEVV